MLRQLSVGTAEATQVRGRFRGTSLLTGTPSIAVAAACGAVQSGEGQVSTAVEPRWKERPLCSERSRYTEQREVLTCKAGLD